MKKEFKRPGKIVLELNASKGNPRNSEGAFIEFEDKILFVYSKFTGKTSRDNDTACIAVIESKDNGDTWSSERIIATPDKAKNLMSVSLLKMGNGDIGLFYLIRKGWSDTRLCLRRSKDGVTWSEPSYCMETKGYYEVHNDRVIMLKNGRIIIPAAYYRVALQDKKPTKRSFRGIGIFFISDDDGETWYESLDYCFMPHPRSLSGLQEPGVMELSNGDLWAWFRTDMGYQYESFSRDCGLTWTTPQPSVFTSCDSPLSMKQIPKEKTILNTRIVLAVFNPIPSSFVHCAERNPFIMSVSKNDGRTWKCSYYLENPYETGVGYCYTAMHFTSDSVLLAYGAGECDKGRSCLERLRIQKLEI